MSAHRWNILVLLVSCLALGAVGSAEIAASVADVLPEDSLWVGQLDQHRKGPNGKIHAALWIQSRKGDEFSGVMWYPKTEEGTKLSTALFEVGGRLDASGKITLDAYKVLAGKGWETGKTSGSISKGKLTTQVKDDEGRVAVDLTLTRVDY